MTKRIWPLIQYKLLLLALATLLLVLNARNVMSEVTQLEGVLVLQIGQAGFAGVTGTAYTIDEQGYWTVQQFINENLGEVESEGSLSGDRLNALAELVDDSLKQLSDPAPPGINPVSIELNYGSHHVVSFLESDADIKPCCVESDTNCAVVNLAAWLKENLVLD